MTKREKLESKVSKNLEKIQALKEENATIKEQLILLSDKTQWFVEQVETSTERIQRKKVKVDRLIGRIHWKEDFKDDDTGEVVTIERSRVVRVNNEWVS